ncbi:MAG: MarR family transcriptional regulator [Bauldia sp.]|nr:MarR family transcriptional regulator [Bauldia sp.]
MSDLELRDTPALAVLSQQPEALGHIRAEHIAAAQDLLRVSKKLLGAFTDEFALHGLSPGRYALLMGLYAARQSLAPSEIADRLGVTRATVTDLITGLVRDGLVASAPADDRDRRRKAIVLTPAGKDLLGGLVPEIFARMAEIVAPLSAQELTTLVQLLRKVEVGLGRSAPSATEEQGNGHR